MPEDQSARDVRTCVTFVVEVKPLPVNEPFDIFLADSTFLENNGKELSLEGCDPEAGDVKGSMPFSRRSRSSRCSCSVASAIRRKPSVSANPFWKFVFTMNIEQMRIEKEVVIRSGLYLTGKSFLNNKAPRPYMKHYSYKLWKRRLHPSDRAIINVTMKRKVARADWHHTRARSLVARGVMRKIQPFNERAEKVDVLG